MNFKQKTIYLLSGCLLLLLISKTDPVFTMERGVPYSSATFTTLPFRESPFPPLIGIHPIAKGQARSQKHFAFDYDAEGRPIEVCFKQGGRVVELNESANYYFYAPCVKISYGERSETRSFFDKHGNRITVVGEVFQEEYELDEKGYRKSLNLYDVHHQPVENSWGVARYQWTILDDGTVLEKRFNLQGDLAPLRAGFPFYELRLHYGAYGWLALMQNYGQEGRLTRNQLNAAQDRLDMRANGDLLSWNVLDENGNLATGNGPGVARGILEYDERGYEVVERYEDENGKPIKNAYGFSYSRKVTDQFGNRIEVANYTLDGSTLLVSMPRGYARYTATYDEHGRNRELISFFDEHGRPTPRAGRGYYYIRSIFDANDNEIQTRFENADEELIDREDTGIALIERDFDRRGRLLETRFFDEGMKPINHARLSYSIERREYEEHGVPSVIQRFDVAGNEVN